MSRFVETVMTLPKGFLPKAAEEGTAAFEYLSKRRNVANLMDDPDLLFIMDDRHPNGGLLYVFEDHSSLVYNPAQH